jgi:hypothetical protein
LKHWAQEAITLSRLEAFVAEWTMIDDKLKHQPLKWGDPLYDLKHSNTRVFRGLGDLFIVHYAVDYDHRISTIKDILPMSWSGFSKPG